MESEFAELGADGREGVRGQGAPEGVAKSAEDGAALQARGRGRVWGLRALTRGIGRPFRLVGERKVRAFLRSRTVRFLDASTRVKATSGCASARRKMRSLAAVSSREGLSRHATMEAAAGAVAVGGGREGMKGSGMAILLG